FFFSSRRRHTRVSRDWSSDVCSSDLDTTQSTGTNDGDVPQDGPAVTAAGTLAGLVTVGADEAGTFSFKDAADVQAALDAQNLESKGETIVYAVTGTLITGYVESEIGRAHV